MISSIGHVALQVPNLDASVAWATTVMGLREVAREGKTSYLTHAGAHQPNRKYEGSSRREKSNRGAQNQRIGEHLYHHSLPYQLKN